MSSDAARTIGKFEVLRLLGRGAQSAVYLARDPQLQRDVAIKLLRAGPRDGGTRALLDEARAVSRLRHDSIVPIFEAGEHNGAAYLVFEYVDGRTLAQMLRDDGALAAPRAAELMMQVLDAIGHAHAARLVHRDLKPANIFISHDGKARVIDFGLAARVSSASSTERELAGTPAYMAPEYIATREVSPAGDVFAAGLILFEMLFGQPAIRADNAFQAMHLIANEPLVFPADFVERIGEGLHDIIAKATARDRSLRYDSARQFRDALAAWLTPAAAGEAKPQQSTLDFLLRRMRHKSDFPAMSTSISAINRLAGSARSDAAALSNAILKDYALTNKILRLANSAYYGPVGRGRVSTVSRATVILGFDAVRNIAISLMLFEHIQDKQQAQLLRDEFLRSALAGLVARELGGLLGAEQHEEGFICALFHHLGRLLTHYYFREEAEAITRMVARDRIDEQQAALQVLGISYENLGVGVAQSWGFPDSIVLAMRRVPPGRLGAVASVSERLRLVSALANETAAMLEKTPPAGRDAATAALALRFGSALPVSARDLGGVGQRAAKGLAELAETLNIDLAKTSMAAQVTGTQDKTGPEELAMPGRLGEVTAAAAAPAAAASGDGESILAAGIQELSQAMVEDVPIGDLLRIIGETLFRAVRARRVLMCTRDGRSGQMVARFGFGADVDEALRHFRFDIRTGGGDLFNAVLDKEVDVLISDAADVKVARHLPGWFQQHLAAQSFLLMPMRVKHTPVALIYADHAQAGGVVVSSRELALLRALRNQALIALRHSATTAP